MKANAALMNNAGSAGLLLLTFRLLSTCQAARVCQSSSGSAELGHVSTAAKKKNLPECNISLTFPQPILVASGAQLRISRQDVENEMLRLEVDSGFCLS